MAFDLLDFGLWTHCSFLLISSFQYGNVSILCLFVVVFWMHVTCLVSQVHNWGGILPWDESYLEFQPIM